MVTRRELLGKQGEWIVELFVGGVQFRFGTVPVEITTGSGDSVKFAEGLDELTQGLSSEGSPDFSIALSVDAGEDWTKIIGRHNVIERSPAILRRVFTDQTLPEARIVIEGTIEGFAYGEINERIQFNIVRRSRTQSRMLPSPGMVADETTWPVNVGKILDESIVGAFYPIIIGSPGIPEIPNVAINSLAATEALLVESGNPDPWLLIAGHKVAATEVRIYDYTEPGAVPSALRTVQTTRDLVGREISYVDMQASGITMEEGRIYYTGWSVDGGLINPKGGGSLRGAGDVIEWMIQTWTDIKIDNARFAGVKERLNAYKIDTYLNTPWDPMAWLNAEVFPLLPVEPRQGEDGLYWYMRRWDATENDAIARLDADQGQIQRESLVTTESAQVVNEVSVLFGPDRNTGRATFRTIIGAQDQTRANDEIEAGLVTTDSRMVAGYQAALSQSNFGRQPIEIQANSIWDRSTAVLIGRDIIAEQALPRRFIEYSGGTDLESFNIGDIIILNDTKIQLLDVVAQILDITVGGADVLLSFELFDDPVVSERLAS